MSYVHGYSYRESQRLQDQSYILEKLLHHGTEYPNGSRILETGCGVGAQTRILAKRNPDSQITSIDLSSVSLEKASALIQTEQLANVAFRQMNIMNLEFEDDYFDHVFVCFVLEHLSDPVVALKNLKRILKPGGSITVIEGDHGSCFWHPETQESLQVWKALIKAQQALGHDPLIGRKLYPLLKEAGYNIEDVGPRQIYTDALRPKLSAGMVNKIIVPMVTSAKQQIWESGIVTPQVWEQGLRDLEITGKRQHGTFFYTWFKALAFK